MYLGVVIPKEIQSKLVRWDVESTVEEVHKDHGLAGVVGRDILA